jgi:hypothetical protein
MDRSSGKIEEPVYEADFACHTGLRQDAVAAPDHAHNLKTPQGCGGCLEALCRSDHTLVRAVIRFDDIVEICRGPMPDIVRQQGFAL